MKGVPFPVAAAALLLAAAGCGKPVLRLADASLGDYYTEEEYQKLSDEQRIEYCNELASQRETFEAEVADANEALAALRLGASGRRAEADSLRAVADQLEERVRAGQAAALARGSASSASTYTVKRGDSLWRISGRELGRPAAWGRIYEANRKLIADPDLIYPGQELVIPR